MNIYYKKDAMKKFLLLLLFIIQYSANTFSREAHVIPLYQERLTNKWCALFAHDAGGLWSMFSKEFVNDKDALTYAMQALKEQTNGVYSFSEENLYSTLALENGDKVYCVPVKHMTIPMLNKKVTSSVDQNVKKDKYLWLPIEDVLARNTVTKMARNVTSRYRFNTITKAVFKNYWEPYFQPDLNAQVNRHQALKCLEKKNSFRVVTRKVRVRDSQKSDEKKDKRLVSLFKSLKPKAGKNRWSIHA